MNEEKKTVEYYQNKEVSLSVDFDTENLLKALGITEEDSFENHQIRFKTLLNLIEKLQKENNKLNIKLDDKEAEIQILKDDIKADDIEYKHVIEILKKENEEYSKQLDLDYVDKNYIPIQKVKNKIEKEIKYHERNILDIENITMLKGKTAKEEAEIEFNKYAIVVLKKILQELIEEREEK